VFASLAGTFYFLPKITELDVCRSGNVWHSWENITDTVYNSDEFPAIGRYYCILEANISREECKNLDKLTNINGCKWGAKTSGGKRTLLYVMRDPVAPANVTWRNPQNLSYMPASQYFVNWTNSTDADGDNVTYLLEIFNTSNFTDYINIEYRNATINETPNPTGAWISGLSNGTKYARILATDGNFNSSWTYRTWVQNTGNFSYINFTFSNGTYLSFLANASIATCVPAVNQTSNTSLFIYFNNQSISMQLQAKVNVTSENITFGCWNNATCDSRVELNTTWQNVGNTTISGSKNYIWCWANFSNASSPFFQKWDFQGVPS